MIWTQDIPTISFVHLFQSKTIILIEAKLLIFYHQWRLAKLPPKTASFPDLFWLLGDIIKSMLPYKVETDPTRDPAHSD